MATIAVLNVTEEAFTRYRVGAVTSRFGGSVNNLWIYSDCVIVVLLRFNIVERSLTLIGIVLKVLIPGFYCSNLFFSFRNLYVYSSFALVNHLF